MMILKKGICFYGQLFFVEDDDISLPPGGSKNQVLTKKSQDDGDADWQTPKITWDINPNDSNTIKPKLLNILLTKTNIETKKISIFNLCPKYDNKIANIALPKKPVRKTPISNFLLKDETTPPNTESNAATIATAK